MTVFHTIVSTATSSSNSGGETLTWSSSSDWDSASSESGVVHASVANTDYNSESVVQKGYNPKNPLYNSNLIAFYPLHEDTGSTAYDFSGNNNDGTINGAVLNEKGLLGTSSYYFDGSDDNVDLQNPPDAGSFTFSAWVWIKNDTGDKQHVAGDGNTFLLRTYSGLSGWRYRTDNAQNDFPVNGGISTKKWSHVVVTYNGSTGVQEVFWNGNSLGTATTSEGQHNSWDNLGIGSFEGGNDLEVLNGNITDVRIYNKSFSSSKVKSLYNIVETSGNLTTSVKSYSSSVKPSKLKTNATLNGGDITIDIYGSPGTASEEVNTISLDGSGSYSLSWNNSHKEFQVEISLSSSDPTETPTVSNITLKNG